MVDKIAEDDLSTTIEEHVGKLQEQLSIVFPDIPKDQITKTIRLLFDFASIPWVNINYVSNSEKFRYQMETTALRHELTHHLVSAISPEASDDQVNATYTLLTQARYLAENKRLLTKELSGVRREAAIASILSTNLQHRVYLPDYNDLTRDGSLDGLGIRKKIRFITVSPKGTLFFVQTHFEDMDMQRNPLIIKYPTKITFPDGEPRLQSEEDILSTIAAQNTNEGQLSPDFRQRKVIKIEFVLPVEIPMLFTKSSVLGDTRTEKVNYIRDWLTVNPLIIASAREQLSGTEQRAESFKKEYEQLRLGRTQDL